MYIYQPNMPIAMENNFAKRFGTVRKMAGLSLQSLADQLGNIITEQPLSKYELGIMKPDSALVIALAENLHVPVDYFFMEPLVAI
jgi:transcriptional regulator with XRE-family HTH domain